MPISVDKSEAPICSTSIPWTAAIAPAFSTASGVSIIAINRVCSCFKFRGQRSRARLSYQVKIVIRENREVDERRVWAAAIFPIGHSEVFGGMWDTNQLYWTRAEAIAEIEDQVIKMGLLPM